VVIGMSEVPRLRFLGFNMLGAAIWAALITAIGYVFGQSLSWLLADLAQYEELGVVLIIAIAIVISVVHRLRKDKT
jgi:membrane protein DedA with SNARE-associated domain